MGLIATDDRGQSHERKAWCVPQGGAAFIYVLAMDAKSGDRRPSSRIDWRSWKASPAWCGPDGIARLGLPRPEANGESPDLVLLTGPGYSFAEVVTGDAVAIAGGLKGSHGHDPAAGLHARDVHGGRRGHQAGRAA